MKKRLFLTLTSLCAFVAIGFISPGVIARPKQAKKMPSGIKGEIVRIGFPPINPEECPECPFPGTRILIPNWTVIVRRAGDKHEVGRIKTDKNGYFKFMLPPGKYNVVANPDDMGGVPNHEQTVTVTPGKFKYVWVVFDGGW